jgi:MFS transporter, ACS family, glucarate transporter
MKPTRVRYGVMGFLCALSFLTYYDRACISRVQQDIQNDLGLTDEELALVFSAFSWAYALFEMPSGALGDRYGARGTLTRIVLAWSLFTALTGMATGFVMLLAARFLFGAGEAGAYPNMAGVQAKWLPFAERARAGGVLWLMARWGAAFAAPIFGVLLLMFDSEPFRRALATVPGLESIKSWRLGFIAAGLIGALWCVLFYVWFRDDPTDKRSVNAAELELIHKGTAARHAPAHHGASAWWMLVRSPSVCAMAMYYILGSTVWFFFMTWLPRYLKDVYQYDYKSSQWVSGLPFLCGGVSCLVGGLVSDRLVRFTGRKYLGRAICPMFGVTIAAVAMLLVRNAESVTQAVSLMCVTAAAFDFGQAANWATIVDIGGKHAGLSTGFINMVGNLGTAISPLLAVWIFKWLGWPALFSIYAAIFVAAGAMWLLIDPNKAFYESSSSKVDTAA